MGATGLLTGWRAVSQIWPFPQGGPRRSIRLMTHHQAQLRLLACLLCDTGGHPVPAEPWPCVVPRRPPTTRSPTRSEPGLSAVLAGK